MPNLNEKLDNNKIDLELKNIGPIKEAKLDISGLSVIAGENDSGKSTVGKALVATIKALNVASYQEHKNRTFNYKKNKKDASYSIVVASAFNNKFMRPLFENQISKNGSISLKQIDCSVTFPIVENECKTLEKQGNKKISLWDCTMIQTPFVWDWYDFFDSLGKKERKEIEQIEERQKRIFYPFLMKNVFDLLEKKLNDADIQIQYIIDSISEIIGGTLVKPENKNFKFRKKNNEEYIDIALKNVATGIKFFGLIQILLRNGHARKNKLLIFDEPENHLHPAWQIKLAEIFVRLSGEAQIPIIVNTHSPYIIEAIDKYGRKYEKEFGRQFVNFYFADKNKKIIEKIKNDNSATLEQIYKALEKPFDVLAELDYKNMEY
ncbi:hypothetical protein CQA38_01890 [Campylobacter sp. MIT 12-5580]|uniref:AAA family ATPase n=1 Tax=Campylobacter sp. MIT 12-5580 TaxID=2040651 RepID=UPI0010F95F10|nr:AAA family ATPase [Campylobacter sp. MIT 12-5580]TKX29555.1 hypothetical protein CQA38_01890 [Campylobacter sp. MIT 12-5580]